MQKLQTVTAVSLVLSCSIYSSVSLSQENQANEESVEQITVTARKRTERLIDVPDQITAFSEADILSTGIDSVEDVTQLLPNLSIVDTQNPGTVFINIRGVGQYGVLGILPSKVT